MKSAENNTKSKKLNFSKEELKITDLEGKYEDIVMKTEKAKGKLPSRKIRKKERIYNEDKQKAETKLSFEKEDIPINEAKWNKPKKRSIPSKAVGSVGTAGVNKLHSKVYEVEHENVGTQAAHRAEVTGESAYHGGKKLVGSAYRFVKNTPYRNVSKLETKSVKTQAEISYQKALQDNPDLKNNILSRYIQKRGIKKQYAEALRTAKNTAQSVKTVKTTKSVVSKASAAVTGVIRRNPVVLAKGGLILLIIVSVMSMFTMCASLVPGIMNVLGTASYTADNTDICEAELLYTEMETDLLLEILNTESVYEGYDEYNYVYTIGDIGHDPFELISFLTAVYDGFTFDEIEPVLRDIFGVQYNIEYVTEIDPVTEHSVLNVILTVKPLSEVIGELMINESETQRYEILMQSGGSKHYIGNPFDFDWSPYVTSGYGYRVHPISGEKDYHKGIDISAATGTEIRAGIDGTVTVSRYDSSYGNYIVINDGNGNELKYAHCDTLLFTVGQTVVIGDIIATAGNTGNSTGSHLHMEVLKDGNYLNPCFFVKKN
jgi:Membrane proteins related to metalloendopeptidases